MTHERQQVVGFGISPTEPLLVITPDSQEFHQLEWIIGLNPGDTLIDCILPLLLTVSIHENTGVRLFSRGGLLAR